MGEGSVVYIKKKNVRQTPLYNRCGRCVQRSGAYLYVMQRRGGGVHDGTAAGGRAARVVGLVLRRRRRALVPAALEVRRRHERDLEGTETKVSGGT